jgi:DNA polymerase-3 subunit epsilon
VTSVDARVRDACFAAIDLEFTGLDPRRDRVVEVAVVRLRKGEVEAEFSSLVRPECTMSAEAVRITGLSDSLLASAPSFADIAPRVLELLADAVLVSHNIPTDLGFLQRELERCGLPLAPPIPAVDTLLAARRLFGFPRNNLVEVAARLGVAPPGHRALSDARATAGVLGRILEILDPNGEMTVEELVSLVDALAPNSPLRLRQQQQITDAWRRRRTVWIDYLSTSDPVIGSVHREVQVWAIKAPRFQGWCLLRADERVFRMDRVTSVKEGEGEFVVPEFKRRL